MIVIGMNAKKLHQVAVVEIDGAIGTKVKANEYVKLLRSIEENSRIRAVVLDIDSPGGSASGSNYLYLAVKSLAAKKPVVAFIRGIGASGAYMLSCPATRIITIPSSIIGSIGVISMRPMVYEAMERIGVSMHVTKSDRLKDMGSMFREATPEEEAKERELIDDLYDQFLDIVAEGRHMEKAKVKDLATGEIFTGKRSVEVGLADELGDLERAIDVAAELGDAPRKPVWMKPHKGLRDVLSTMVASSVAGTIVTEVVSQLEERAASARYNVQHRL